MARPIIGIISNQHTINNEYEVQAAGLINISAVADVADGLPLLIPAEPGSVHLNDLLTHCAGFVFTGGRANVHPEEYGEEETPAHGSFDR
jgi:putative glutamine amidotransferase